MAARDRYSVGVKCPKCGLEGTLHLSEDDHPYMSNPHRSVDRVDGDFQASVARGVDVNVECGKCGEHFTH